jgi:hypothetical protein
VPPCQFKDGDVISDGKFIAIFHKFEDGHLYYRCWYNKTTKESKYKTDFGIGYYYEYTYATEEEKEKLFQAIKDNGYKWNAETKTLEKLIKPKFKVGDRIKYKNGKNIDGVEQGIILSITDDTYDVAVTNDMGIFIPVTDQDNWELVPNKFDITTLKPFDKVLVRDCNEDKWNIDFFGYYRGDGTYQCMTFTKYQCIPYEVNKELLGTTNNPKEYGSE